MKLVSVFGVVGVATLLAACGQSPDAGTTASEDEWLDRAAEPVAIAVESITADWERMVGDITASGLTRGAHEVTVVSETQGIIESVNFTLGEPVEAGTVLVTFDESIEQLSVDEAAETLSSAELDLRTAERLFETGNGSQAAVTRARSVLAGARARLAQAEKALADRSIESPIAGLVASVDASVQTGNTIQRGVPIARIIDTSMLEVELAIGEREVQYLERGAAAAVRFAGQTREVGATVEAIGAGSDPRTGSFPVIVRWTNTLGERARAGLSVTVRIPPVNAPWAITIPANAVRSVGQTDYVFVDAAGVAEQREITAGERFGDRIAVRSGLAAGETVIVSGLGQLTDGVLVESTLLLASN